MTAAQTPPFGWNSWDCYGAAVDEETVRRNARCMAEKLKPFGWEYIVVDIQWSQPEPDGFRYVPFSALRMDAFGRLLPAEKRFPSAANGQGFKPLANYVHSLGLKFGIHIMRGLPREAAHRHLPIAGSRYGCHQAADPASVCAWNPDMYGLCCDEPAAADYYRSIFALYAAWGVDFVKCDDIAREYPRCRREIELISEAARGCGREMVLSLSPGPAPLQEAEHLKRYANMWRITDDFWDSWPLMKGMFERAEKWCVHAGPGHWPDADMLPLGAIRRCTDPNGWTALTQPEQRTLMSLWCIMRSPLMMGGDLSLNDAFTESLLTNARILEMETASWCAHPLITGEEESIWVAPRQDGSGFYAALFNLSDRERTISMPVQADEITELWSGRRCQAVQATLQPHDAAVFLSTYRKTDG